MKNPVLKEKDGRKIKEEIFNFSDKHIKKICKYCYAQIMFKDVEGKKIPVDLNDEPHWKTCPNSSFVQKRFALQILKKVLSYQTLKADEPDYLDSLALGAKLDEVEIKVVRSILVRSLKDYIDTEAQDETNREIKTDIPEDALTFKPVPTDPISDPDEDRAPEEHNIEKDLNNRIEATKLLEEAIKNVKKDGSNF